MLRLTGSDREVTRCPECKGRGTVPCPPTFGVRGQNERGGFKQVSAGHPIPCPTCKGKKVT